MARNGAGVFAVLNPILVGALRSSAFANADCVDQGNEITNTLPLDGTAAMTGAFKAADGSLTAPGMAFANETRTGFRKNGPGEMRWVGGGTDRFYIDANGKAWHLGAQDIAGATVGRGAWTSTVSDPVMITAFTQNGAAVRTSNTPSWTPDNWASPIGFTHGGFGIVPQAATMFEMYVPFAGTISAVALAADQTGSCVIDIRKAAYASYSATVPGSANSICGGNYPTLSSAVGLLDQTLAGWTTAVAAGDCIRFVLVSCSTITRLSVTLSLKRFV